jgi:hypothetical protein
MVGKNKIKCSRGSIRRKSQNRGSNGTSVGTRTGLMSLLAEANNTPMMRQYPSALLVDFARRPCPTESYSFLR